MNKTPSQPLLDPEPDDWSSRRHVHLLVLILATALGIYLCYRLAEAFIPPLAWALALAVLCIPLQRWLERKIKRPTLAAFLTVLLVALVVTAIAGFVSQRLVSEAAKGATAIKTSIEAGEWTRAIESNPTLAPIGRWLEENADITGTAGTVATWMTTKGASLVRGSVVQVLGLFLTFYFLFFYLRDRKDALSALRTLSPLTEAEFAQLFARVSDTIQATVYGTLAVAAIQGTLGGLMFWWLGLPGALLWGVIMGLLAIIPVLGAFVVWIPAAIFLAAQGSWGKALILTVWGGVVIGGIDNLLYPMLIGNRLKMHTLVAFISVVGGLMFFGASGLILGPIVFAVTTLLLEIWHRRNAKAAS